jgi:hypothetical protein
MQGIRISPGKAQCRFCGDEVPQNRLSTHIASKHARPARPDLTPTLVRKRREPETPTSK